MSAIKGVKRLAKERPDWIPILKACVEAAKESEEFCGNWVRKRMENKMQEGRNYGEVNGRFLGWERKHEGNPPRTVHKVWFPGLRTLVRYGILKHEDTTRGGRRAYYTMPDIESVEKSLAELEPNQKTVSRG